MIADQLGLKVSTVANFFMNARRRSTEKYCDDNDDDGGDREPPVAAAASGPIPAVADPVVAGPGADWKPPPHLIVSAAAAGTIGPLSAVHGQLPAAN